jgi:dephospho-CoA kinase
MRIEEIVKSLEEGPNDPHIFKAVFLAGGPGSGKSFVANKMLKGTGLKTVNSDDIFEYLMKKHDLDMGDPDVINSPQVQDKDTGIRAKAKKITGRKQSSHIEGRLGLIIDGTGKDVDKVSKTSEELKALGYETMMLFVNTSEEVAQERNLQRARTLERGMVSKMWKQVQNNLMKFQQVFGAANFHVVDNSGGLEDPDRKENFNQVAKSIDKFLSAAPRSRAAKQWLSSQKK